MILPREGESCDHEIKATAEERRRSGQGSDAMPIVVHMKQGDRRGWRNPTAGAEQRGYQGNECRYGGMVGWSWSCTRGTVEVR
jgi:hypothetical protein